MTEATTTQELTGRHLLGREIVPSAWSIDRRGDA
jgi:hypothetical protein